LIIAGQLKSRQVKFFGQFTPNLCEIGQFAANVLPIIEEIERSGFTSHNAIAGKLNERRVPTARGGKWTHIESRKGSTGLGL
jgi:hypothetical protein